MCMSLEERVYIDIRPPEGDGGVAVVVSKCENTIRGYGRARKSGTGHDATATCCDVFATFLPFSQVSKSNRS
jgi:hypothetical protein